MAKEYIEKEVAIRAAQDGVDEWDGGCNKHRNTYIARAINKVTPADVKPVVRGKWIDKGYHEEWTFECSACGGYSPEEYNFCPHCSADMQGEKIE